MKDRIYTATEIVAALDKEWDRCFEMADLGIITKEEAWAKSTGVLCAAKSLGLVNEFNNYDPQPDADKTGEKGRTS
jgi:hypothetical protein